MSQHIIQLATQHAVPVIVDPKSVSMNKYKGADYVTPNMSEFKLMASVDAFKNESELYSAAKSLLNESQVKHCLLTRSEKGMSLITPTDKYDFSTKVIEVSDVTGAGDTVVSALALGVALGCDQNDIIEFANHAAGVVVSKLGTATASLKEIQDMPNSYSIDTIQSFLTSHQSTIVFTNGCFDLLHPGHVDYLTKHVRWGMCWLLA